MFKDDFDFDDLLTPAKDVEEDDVNSHEEAPYYCTPAYMSSFKGSLNDPIHVPDVSDKKAPSSLRTDEIAASNRRPLGGNEQEVSQGI